MHSLWVGLYETMNGPIVTYGGESWTLTNNMERALMLWEMKILWKICGTKYENGYCWIKWIKKFIINLNLQVW